MLSNHQTKAYSNDHDYPISDEYYMKIAIDLAKKGFGKTSPNPVVGAVIVKNGEIIGQGWHERFGEAHAETNALNRCSVSPKDATLYVTLEPCCHYGKQPPCTSKIIESGISRVVIGSLDPNPQVSGKGIELLKNHGIHVDTRVLQSECDSLNMPFFHFISTNTPYVILKYAMTADGKLATYTGESKWITGEKARKKVHSDRKRYCAVLVGVETVISDNPMLNCRLEDPVHPIRIICDTKLRTPLDSNVVTSANTIPTIIATACDDLGRQKEYETCGCSIIQVPKLGGHIDLKALIELLGTMKIDSVIIEGGSQINWSALKAGIINRVQVYIGAKLFGGSTSKTPISGEGIMSPEQSAKMKLVNIETFDDDCLLEYEIY